MQDNTFIIQDPSNNNPSPFSTWDINPTAKRGKRGRRRKETADGNAESSPVPKKPGRKQVLTAPISKRQMQNREAQRLFRERKTRQQEDLLNRIRELEKLHQQSQQENCQLKDLAEALKEENKKLQISLKAFKEDCKEDFNNLEFRSLSSPYFGSPNSSPSPSVSLGDMVSSPPFSSRDIMSSPVDMRDARSSSMMSMEEYDRDSSVDLRKLPSMSPMLSLPQTNSGAHEISRIIENPTSGPSEPIPLQIASSGNLQSLDSPSVVPLPTEPIVKQEVPDGSGTCNLQSSMLSLNVNEGNITVEYVDLLVEELHELCKEMKHKAMISSEPFEFEWPCDEIDNRLNEVNHFGQA
ncbi:hypothetical protein K493DRAFT_320288 [Basidiobolus meristosporus CBS 931.73]|uniref:BZIP domain-containing protein n=1 Tax=Basidiobolus meristosporus CBS 931.73 TaxID=1314790 RepID=A0A1Y1XCU6_9FUNG|nr:hypothetical protein K493DRAFT_320288 [Basidiobolus meristosporus CBS 931.73]|eukprot:ORX83256.1 hypothetical protein K493DRAFT_320288 [Basidiobolus meristosporus CBS 931.73]